jgi:hypothetical protein
MAAVDTDIANMALRLMGVSRTITTLDAPTEDARACTAFYAQARDECLEAWDWPFARRAGVLALVEEAPETSAADGGYHWLYSYRVPSGAIKVRSLRHPTSRVTTDDTSLPWMLADDAEGLIYTDTEDAYAVWTTRVTDVTRFPATFTVAMAALLAAYIAPSLVQGASESAAKVEQMYALYERKLAQAKVHVANQGGPDVAAESAFIRARD